MKILKVATVLVVSGVTLYVVYRCYKYGTVFGKIVEQEEQEENENKQRNEEGTETTTSCSASPSSRTNKRKS